MRRARLRGKQGSILEVTGLQPFLEHHLVREDMSKHPLMADVVEGTHDTLPPPEIYRLTFASFARTTPLKARCWRFLPSFATKADPI